MENIIKEIDIIKINKDKINQCKYNLIINIKNQI